MLALTATTAASEAQPGASLTYRRKAVRVVDQCPVRKGGTGADALRETLRAMQSASRDRPVDFLSMEGTGDRCSELRHTRYRNDERETTLISNCNPHGRWLEWLL